MTDDPARIAPVVRAAESAPPAARAG